MYGFWFIRFWTSAWNVFDTVVVSIGVLDPWLDELSPLTHLDPADSNHSSLILTCSVGSAGGETSFRAEPMSALRSMMKYATFFEPSYRRKEERPWESHTLAFSSDIHDGFRPLAEQWPWAVLQIMFFVRLCMIVYVWSCLA